MLNLPDLPLTLIAALISGPLTAVFTVYLTSWVRRFRQEKEVLDSLEHELNLNRSLIKRSIEDVENQNLQHQPKLLYTSAFDDLRAKGEIRLFPYPIRTELTSLYHLLNELNTTVSGDRSLDTESLKENLENASKSSQTLWDYVSDYKKEWRYEYPVFFYYNKIKRKWKFRARKWKYKIKGTWEERIEDKQSGLEIEYEIPSKADIPKEGLFFYKKALENN